MHRRCSAADISLQCPVMKSKSINVTLPAVLVVVLCLCAFPATSLAQQAGDDLALSTTWVILQTVPSLTWTAFPAQTHFALEWEATPVLYSFGMTRLDPPFHFFLVNQPERFAGSLELNVSAQFYTSKIGTFRWGFSGQLLAHLPLVQKGEYLGFNAGVARYTIAGTPSNYLIAGFSTLFGFVHFNVKYSPDSDIWMNSIEFRFF
jgi:hypothetical protein